EGTTARRVNRGRAEIRTNVPLDGRAHGIPDEIEALQSSRRMATFENLFPTFLQKCAELHELLRIVAFMLFIVGTILFVLHGFSGKTLMLHMMRLFVLTALLVMLPQWGNQAQSLVQTSILDGLGVDPSHVQDQYNQLLVVRRDTSTGHS